MAMAPFLHHDGRPGYPVTFWHRTQNLGSGRRPAQTVRNTVVAPESKAFFCPHCGEIWARVYVEGQPFQSYAQLCEKHAGRNVSVLWDVPGSIWLDWDREYLDSLPPAVVLREFQLHLAQWDRLQEQT